LCGQKVCLNVVEACWWF